MSSHTPGPWIVEPINDGQTYQITTTDRTGFAVIAETPIDGTGRDAVNARLLAAAPAMLAQLRADADSWELEGFPDNAARVREVIRQATGRAET